MQRAVSSGLALVAVAFVTSCGGDDAAIHPAALFSGYDDGSTEFKVPATLAGGGTAPVSWSIDSSMGSIATEKGNSRHVIVTTKRSGTTTLKATVDGNTYEAKLTITKYAVGARELGNELYQIDRTGANPDPGSTPSDVKGLGCIGCHGTKGGPGHSPSEIGGYDDAAILKTIATAQLPRGGLANDGQHKFTLDDKQKEGILARLRSLEPNTYPP